MGEDELEYTYRLSEAWDALESLGVRGLCHPSSDDFAPFFPHCPLPTPSHRDLLIDGKEDWFYVQNALMACLCVCGAALAAGLTMGLMSLDPLVLLIKMRAGATDTEKQQAAGLLPIVKQHHRLLVTLLICNAVANESLPIFLDALVPSYVAVILSVTLVLFFGEIIPSAVFTGPNQIAIASSLLPVVKLVMLLLYPLAYPIAKGLDWILHDHDEQEMGVAYNRGELSALVRIQYEERLAAKKRRRSHANPHALPSHSEHRASMRAAKQLFEATEQRTENNNNSNQIPNPSATDPAQRRSSLVRTPSIHFDEVAMVEGALQMKMTSAMDVYTPFRKVFAIPYDTILDERNTVRIYSSGYSRVPIYMPNPDKPKNHTAICGILITKQLIVVNHSDRRPVSTLPLNIPFCVSPKTNLVDVINLFQNGGMGVKGGHMALVCARPDLATAALDQQEPLPEKAGLMGIITLEDALEQLLQEQILDESDKLERGEVRLAEWAYQKWKLFVKRSQVERETTELEALEEKPKMLDVVDQVLGQSEGSPLLDMEEQGSSTSFKFPFFS